MRSQKAIKLAGHFDRGDAYYVEIAVTDTGSGVNAATLGHVFEPFLTTKPTGQGIGLGLSQLYGSIRQSNCCGTMRRPTRQGLKR